MYTIVKYSAMTERSYVPLKKLPHSSCVRSPDPLLYVRAIFCKRKGSYQAVSDHNIMAGHNNYYSSIGVCDAHI